MYSNYCIIYQEDAKNMLVSIFPDYFKNPGKTELEKIMKISNSLSVIYVFIYTHINIIV